MIHFEKEFFQKIKFTPKQLDRYGLSARRDLEIAQKDIFTEVRFAYCYQALIKLGITILAKKGQVKVRSVPGHHIKILLKLSEILGDEDIFTIGNAMRMKRNQDMYSGGEFISKKETEDYLRFVEGIFKKASKFFS